MKSFRPTDHPVLSRAVALLVCALLVQTLGAAVIHVTLTEHVYCDSHQAFEHADDDGQVVHGAHAEVSDTHHLPSDDSDNSEESCDWFTWLKGPSVPLPQVHAALLNLPPPADAATTGAPTHHALIPSQIDLLRLSPGHSPPAHVDISV